MISNNNYKLKNPSNYIINEIRINEEVASHSIAEYTTDLTGDSKPIINKRTMKIDRLLEKLQSNINNTTKYLTNHLFPPNCRYYEEHDFGHLIVIEEPPALRTIQITKDFSNEVEYLKSIDKLEEYGYTNWLKSGPYSTTYNFHLALPYTIFMITFNKNYEFITGYIFFRSKPISGFADILCKTPFLNISDAENVCFGEEVYNGPRRSIFADTNFIISSFWNTKFNPDYIQNYIEYQNTPVVNNYLTWEYYSKTNPMFIYDIEWLPCQKNIHQMISLLKNSINKKRNNKISYAEIQQLFHSTQINKNIDNIDKPLIYDISQYIVIDDVDIHVGDSFKINNGKQMVIESFIGFSAMLDPSYINIVTENKKTFKIKLTNNFKKYLVNKIKEERFETSVTLSNGLVIKAGDVIMMKNKVDRNIYSKVHYIRKTLNNELEGRFGSEYYIIKNLTKDIEIVNINNFKFNNIKLIYKKEYGVFINDNRISSQIIKIKYGRFKELSTNPNGQLILVFNESKGPNRGNIIKLNLNEQQHQTLFDVDKLKLKTHLCRIGRKLYFSKTISDKGNRPEKFNIIPNVGLLIPCYSTIHSTTNLNDYNKKYIENDRLFIPGYDMDIEFNIGDKVVVFNWSNPSDILNVKRIEKFIEKDNVVKFVLKDKNEKEYIETYINNGNIRVGGIRKITNEWKELKTGMKIISNKLGISMFPKKDVNIIIGFLYDTGGSEPLVLCSNISTLWYNDVIENFKIILKEDPQWKKLNHSQIDLSKIKIQSGDILIEKKYKSSTGYFIYNSVLETIKKAQFMDYYLNGQDSMNCDSSFKENMQFDGFLSPRYTAKQENNFDKISAFPNLHGMYINHNNSPYIFSTNPRSIINVSNNNK